MEKESINISSNKTKSVMDFPISTLAFMPLITFLTAYGQTNTGKQQATANKVPAVANRHRRKAVYPLQDNGSNIGRTEKRLLGQR